MRSFSERKKKKKKKPFKILRRDNNPLLSAVHKDTSSSRQDLRSVSSRKSYGETTGNF